MSVPKIGYADGIDAARERWLEAVTDDDPEVEGKAWPDKLCDTLQTLKDGHNSALDRLDALEAALKARPFFP